ncbi:MAG: SRPBCC family protein [Actinomycetota bacterium]
MRTEHSVEIARPPEEVFEFISDPRNDPRWCEKVLSCEQVTGDGPAVGARYRSVHRPTRIKPKAELVCEIVAFDPPSAMASRQEDEDGVFDVTYEVAPIPEGTRFTQRSEIEWKLPRPLQLVANRMVPRHIEGQMKALKGLLEPLISAAGLISR